MVKQMMYKSVAIKFTFFLTRFIMLLQCLRLIKPEQKWQKLKKVAKPVKEYARDHDECQTASTLHPTSPTKYSNRQRKHSRPRGHGDKWRVASKLPCSTSGPVDRPNHWRLVRHLAKQRSPLRNAPCRCLSRQLIPLTNIQ